ncbi:MAG: hypothetical protein VB861_03180 [Planctomycetaceae bacterium]
MSLLLSAALLASSGCATARPLAGQLDGRVEPAAAGELTVSDSAARVRANSVGDVVPVDAPATVAGTVRLNDASAVSEARPGRAVIVEPKLSSPSGFGPVFRRLEAALDGTDSRPSPPPPPLPRTIRALRTSAPVAKGSIEPAGGSGSSISLSAPADSEPIVQDTVSQVASAAVSTTPRTLEPAPAIAAVVQLPDVTDWSSAVPSAGVVSEGSTTSGRAFVVARTVPWWITVIGLVSMFVLIGLSRRLGWPSVSPLD